MTKNEKTLLNKLKNMELEEYEKTVSSLVETYDFNNCSEDFDINFKKLMSHKFLGDDPSDLPTFEEALQKTLSFYTEEERQSYLNEDWSEFNVL